MSSVRVLYRLLSGGSEEQASCEGVCEGVCEESLLTPGDREYIAGVASERRRRELTAWRSLLRSRRESSESSKSRERREIGYRASGAPYLIGCEDVALSVSHSRSMVGVALSSSACALDIEELGRNFGVVKGRMLTAGEMSRFGHDDTLLPIIWCCKETLYKLYNDIDMLSGIEVLSIDSGRFVIETRVSGHGEMLLHYRIIEGNVIVVSGAFELLEG